MYFPPTPWANILNKQNENKFSLVWLPLHLVSLRQVGSIKGLN